ncbi:MAG: hypothetical protein RR646_04800 [Erysipelotrichaceae bacterium]
MSNKSVIGVIFFSAIIFPAIFMEMYNDYGNRNSDVKTDSPTKEEVEQGEKLLRIETQNEIDRRYLDLIIENSRVGLRVEEKVNQDKKSKTYLLMDNNDKVVDFDIKRIIAISNNHIVLIDVDKNMHLFNVKQNKISNLNFKDIGKVIEYSEIDGNQVQEPYTDIIQIKGIDNKIYYYNKDEEIVASSSDKNCTYATIVRTNNSYKEKPIANYSIMNWDYYKD